MRSRAITSESEEPTGWPVGFSSTVGGPKQRAFDRVGPSCTQELASCCRMVAEAILKCVFGSTSTETPSPTLMENSPIPSKSHPLFFLRRRRHRHRRRVRTKNFANLQGRLDEVALYDRALTPEEIRISLPGREAFAGKRKLQALFLSSALPANLPIQERDWL